MITGGQYDLFYSVVIMISNEKITNKNNDLMVGTLVVINTVPPEFARGDSKTEESLCKQKKCCAVC